MSLRILNRSFSGGEITPELFGRLELSKVQEALALCMNFITLPHGPVINRPGTEFVEEVKNSANATRLIPFSYNNIQTFAIQVGAGYFRFHTNAATLQYSAPAAWSNATAYNVGDMAASGGVNYYCILGNTNNAPPNATYWYVLPVNGGYEIPNPYAAADLMDIHYTQSADVLTLVHPNYPPMELRRLGATTWTLVTVPFVSRLQSPSFSAYTPSPITHTYAVTTQLLLWGNLGGFYFVVGACETVPSTPDATVSSDLNAPGSKNTITWSSATPANFPSVMTTFNGFCVYKKIGSQYQYLGSTSGNSFVDDIFLTPNPSRLAPTAGFASIATAVTATNSVGTVTISATASGGGTGVTYSYKVTAINSSEESLPTPPATCTNNLATAGTANTIAWCPVKGVTRYNVYKLSNGVYGYIGQAAGPPDGTCTFVDNNITPDISRTPPIIDDVFSTPGNYPAAVAYHQQRRIFAGTLVQPQNVWATRSGTESNMGYTIPTRDDNRLAFRIAARDASALRHIVPLQDLLFLSASCEWRCSSTTGVLTPSTISVQPQSYIGANNVMPIVVGSAVLYAAAKGGHIRQMAYNWQINGFQSTDSSIFAPHLFDYNTIADMAYSRGPIPILWCVSSNGKLLGMTYLPDQQIAAWHQHTTGAADAFESICTISENNEDMLYCIVRRNINGTTHRFVERLHTRLYNTVADCHYVDCGSTYNAPSGTFTRSGTAMTCVITAHGLANGQSYWFAFSDSSFGTLGGGTSYVVTVVDANTFTIAVPNSGATSGTVTRLALTVTGLTWLNGVTVNILADGAVLPQQNVSGGAITLPVAASQVHVGLPLTAQLQTPPAAQAADPAMGQGLSKNVNKVFLRTYRSSGILAGPDFADLTPFRQRSTENPGSPPNLVSDEVEILLTNDWGMSGQICIQQSDPLPLDIASMTLEIAVGGGV